jgi:hypothetical protein
VGQVWRFYAKVPPEDDSIMLAEVVVTAETGRSLEFVPCGPFEEVVRAEQARTFPVYALMLLASAGIYTAWWFWIFSILKRFGVNQELSLGLDVPYYWLYIVPEAVPFLGICTCLVYSLQYDFYRTVGSGCLDTVNFIPSVSAAISGTPQCYIYRFSIGVVIALHPFHVIAANACSRGGWEGDSSEPRGRVQMRSAVILLWLLEAYGLLLLTSVSSKEHLQVHQFGFAAFAIGTLLRQPLSCLLLQHSGGPNKPLRKFNIRAKYILASVNTVCLVGAVSTYYWQQHKCTDYVYSVFALFEYLFIFTNMAFHHTIAFDFADADCRISISVGGRKGDKTD